MDILFIVLGLIFAVYGAGGFAKNFGISNRVIGLLIVGPGTSFPELIASIIAARKGSADMVVGNVLGSNTYSGTRTSSKTTTRTIWEGRGRHHKFCFYIGSG